MVSYGCFYKLQVLFWWVSFLEEAYYVGSILGPLIFRNSQVSQLQSLRDGPRIRTLLRCIGFGLSERDSAEAGNEVTAKSSPRSSLAGVAITHQVADHWQGLLPHRCRLLLFLDSRAGEGGGFGAGRRHASGCGRLQNGADPTCRSWPQNIFISHCGGYVQLT